VSQNILFDYFKRGQNLEVLICQDHKESLELESVAKFYGRDVVVFPDLRATFGDDLRVYKEELHELFSCLRRYYTAKKKTYSSFRPLKTLLFHLPKEELLKSNGVGVWRKNRA